VFCTLAPSVVSGQQTGTITLQTYQDQSYCAGLGCSSPSCTPPVTDTIFTFADPLPNHATLRSATFNWKTGNDHSFSWQGIPAISLALNGTPLGTQQTISNYASCSPGSALIWSFPSADYANGFPNYQYGANSSNALTVTLLAQNASVMAGDSALLTLTYELPPPFDFSITDQAPETDRRVLLSNESGYPYPHFQSLGGQDSKVPMFVRARGSNNDFQAGLTVYLRILDPPDTAAYMNLPQPHLATNNDNFGPAAALEGNSISPVANAPGVWTGTSDANGELDFTLALPGGAASGDNYQVEAAFDPTFPLGATTKSGTLTAWKRLYVEKKNMLRNGMRLVADAVAGSTEIHVLVNTYLGNQGRRTISSGDHIVLVHSPHMDRSDALAGWYMEFHNVADMTQIAANDWRVRLGTKQGKNIIAEQLQHSYTIEPLDGTVGDAIAYTAALSLASTDYFDAPDTLINQYDASGNPSSALPQAFADYNMLPATFAGGQFVPIPRVITTSSGMIQHLANRWSGSVDGTGTAVANHQLLLVGDANVEYTARNGPQPTLAGQTTLNTTGIASIVYRGAINYEVALNGSPYSGQNPDNWSAKNEVHELAHQWYVDQNPSWPGTDGFHCPTTTTTFDSTTTFCLEAGGGSGVDAQKDNMIARFHLQQLNGIWDSEYFTIRRRPDPYHP
jgi:hypothetical protein